MYGKKIKQELEKDNVFVSVSTVGRVLKYLIEQNKIQDIHLIKKRKSSYLKTSKRVRYVERIRKQKPNKVT